MASRKGKMTREIGHTPDGYRVTLERESRVEGPDPHVFVYDKDGWTDVPDSGPKQETAEQVAEDLVSGKESVRWISES